MKTTHFARPVYSEHFSFSVFYVQFYVCLIVLFYVVAMCVLIWFLRSKRRTEHFFKLLHSSFIFISFLVYAFAMHLRTANSFMGNNIWTSIKRVCDCEIGKELSREFQILSCLIGKTLDMNKIQFLS